MSNENKAKPKNGDNDNDESGESSEANQEMASIHHLQTLILTHVVDVVYILI